jgi:amino acid adenylation domain-containing protein
VSPTEPQYLTPASHQGETHNSCSRQNTPATPVCIHTWFESQAVLTPEAIALSAGSVSLTYSALDSRANQLAHHLIRQGIRQNTTIGLHLDRSAEQIVALLAILKTGCAYIPLDPDYPANRLKHMLEQAQPELVITNSSLTSFLPKTEARYVCLDSEQNQINAQSTASPDIGVLPEHLCYVMFTSGSTGNAKAVMVTHGNVTRMFQSIRKQVTFKTDDVWTQFHSLSFGFSMWEIGGALLHGGRLVIIPPEARLSPEALHEVLLNESVSVLSLTPSTFRQFLLSSLFETSNEELALRMIVLSGEPVICEDLRDWYSIHANTGPTIISTYAITETGGQISCREFNADNIDEDEALIGTPLDDTLVYILDDSRKTVATGKTGELYVGGPGVAPGYLNQPELTKKHLVTVRINGDDSQRLYRTGDRAQLQESGEIKLNGMRHADFL